MWALKKKKLFYNNVPEEWDLKFLIVYAFLKNKKINKSFNVDTKYIIKYYFSQEIVLFCIMQYVFSCLNCNWE